MYDRNDHYNLSEIFQEKQLASNKRKGTIYFEPHFDLELEGSKVGFISLGKTKELA